MPRSAAQTLVNTLRLMLGRNKKPKIVDIDCLCKISETYREFCEWEYRSKRLSNRESLPNLFFSLDSEHLIASPF